MRLTRRGRVLRRDLRATSASYLYSDCEVWFKATTAVHQCVIPVDYLCLCVHHHTDFQYEILLPIDHLIMAIRRSRLAFPRLAQELAGVDEFIIWEELVPLVRHIQRSS